MEYSRILKEIYEEIQPYAQEGKPASYIPELLKVNPDRYGICLRTIEGKEYAQGDSDERFAVQSISKVFSLAMSFGRIGNELWKRIGVEPAMHSTPSFSWKWRKESPAIHSSMQGHW